MSPPSNRLVERRIFALGAALEVAGMAVVWLIWGFVTAISFIAGGVLAALNMAWLRHTVRSVGFNDPNVSKRHILAGFILRLLLIPLCLYAMIRFLFWSISAAVAGFALFHCSLLLEGILEALNRNTGKHARTE
jgi:hypothetical protein